MTSNKKNLTMIAAALAANMALTGCNTMSKFGDAFNSQGPERTSHSLARNFNGTSAQYFGKVSRLETKYDAAETNREARCLNNMYGKLYDTKEGFYKNLSTCVGKERASDMMTYMPIAILVDGLKLWGLGAGINNAAEAISPSSRTIGSGSVSGNGGSFIRN